MNTDLSNLKTAQIELAQCPTEKINQTLLALAKNLKINEKLVLTENQKDLDRMESDDPKYDRLKLTPKRIEEMAQGLKQLTNLDSPIGKVIEQRTLKNGLTVKQTRVPIGVIGMIYEARPNVTTDAFGIAFKTQNAIALKGGSDAQHTNECVYKIIQETLKSENLPTDVVALLPAERAATKAMLAAVNDIDVIIPRGSQKLIQFVRDNAKVPVIETGAGIVHTYWDESGKIDIVKKVVWSAKTRRPSVCNALDTLIIHETNLNKIADIITPLTDVNVKIYADRQSFEKLTKHYKNLERAETKHFGTEFLGYELSLKTVKNLDKALTHIRTHSSKHSEAIISENTHNIETFLSQVDAACVFHNTETGYSDGEQLELGAEIGISTQKLHARGPMGLEAMTSYKWIIRGNGQTRI